MASGPRPPKAVTPAGAPADDVQLELTLVEARALDVALTHGLAAIEAHHLVRNTGTIEAAIRKFRAALPPS